MTLRRIIFSCVAAAMFLPLAALAQTSPETTAAPQAPAAPQASQNGAAPVQIGSGVVIPAQLSKSLDAKKAKPGDKIEAKTTMDLLSHGQVVIPRDTKVLGHITAAKPHSKDSPDSSVGIAFDRISLKDGHELPVKAAVQAIGRPLNNFSNPATDYAGAAPADAPPSSTTNSRGSMGGSSRPNNSSSYPSSTPGQMPSGSTGGGNPSSVALDPHSQGVVGMKGLELNSTGDTSVVSSANNNVHLDSGTQLVLRTQ